MLKVETKLSLEGKTKIVEATGFPLKIEFFKEVFCNLENPYAQPRQYIVKVEFREDQFLLTGDCVDEVAWKVGKVLLALLGE